jgi:hypothetical protein
MSRATLAFLCMAPHIRFLGARKALVDVRRVIVAKLSTVHS